MQKNSVKKRSFGQGYAWAIAGSGFLTQVVCLSCTSLFGLNILYIAGTMGVEVTSLSLAVSLYGALYALCSFIWGYLADRKGIRLTFTFAALGAGIGFFALGLCASSSLSVIIIYACVGAVVSGVSSAVLPKMVSAWFATNWRGKAFAVVSFGGTFTTMIVGIVGPVLTLSIGWRGSFMVFGVMDMAIALVIFLVCRNSPASMGLLPFGYKADAEGQKTEAQKSRQIKETGESPSKRHFIRRILAMPVTYKLGLIFILWQMYFMAHQAYKSAAILTSGFDLAVAGGVTSIMTGVGIVSLAIWPPLSDKFARKNVLGAVMFGQGITYMMFFFILPVGSVPLLFAWAALVGIFFGTNPMLQTMMAECYPVEMRGTGPGVVSTLATVGRFFGPILAGGVISLCGGAIPSYFFFGGGALCLAGISALLLLPKTSGKYGDPLALDSGDVVNAKA